MSKDNMNKELKPLNEESLLKLSTEELLEKANILKTGSRIYEIYSKVHSLYYNCEELLSLPEIKKYFDEDFLESADILRGKANKALDQFIEDNPWCNTDRVHSMFFADIHIREEIMREIKSRMLEE